MSDEQMPDRIWAWRFSVDAQKFVVEPGKASQGGWNDKVDRSETEYIRRDICASGQQVRALAFIEAAVFIEQMEQVDPPEPMSADMLKAIAGAGLREMAKRLAALTPAPEAAQAEAVHVSPESLTDLIGELGREVYNMLDDCETSGPVGDEVHTITDEALKNVSEILDRIDALPFEVPGVILGPGAMLQEAIKHTFVPPAAPAPGIAEAAKVVIEHEPCPKCASVNVEPYWWSSGQAWIIICQDCRHEEGREDKEGMAWRVWDDAALRTLEGQK